MISAINNHLQKNPDPAIRLLKSDFSDVTLGIPVQMGSQKNYWQDMNFADLTKLKDFMGTYTRAFAQNIPDVNCADVLALEARILNRIVSSSKPGGAYDYYTRMLVNSGGTPQCPLQLYRYWSTGSEIPELKSIYYKYDFYLQPDLITRLSPSGWIMGTEIKTGKKVDPSVGDYRIKCGMLYTSGVLKWDIAGDNQANMIGNPSYPAGGGDPTYPWENSLTTYWHNDIVTSGEVPLGEWCTLHFEYIRPSARADLISGRFTVALERANGGYQLLHNQQGGMMAGAYFMPMTRIILINPYSKGSAEIYHRITNLEVWTKAPFNMIAHKL